jgi:dTDP-glucose 4,6-dehydratase
MKLTSITNINSFSYFSGQIYNISSSDEMTNLQLCQYLGKKFGHTVDSEFMEYTEDRAINDLRYLLIY